MNSSFSFRFLMASVVLVCIHVCAVLAVQVLGRTEYMRSTDLMVEGKASEHMQIALIRKRSKKQTSAPTPVEQKKIPIPMAETRHTISQPIQEDLIQPVEELEDLPQEEDVNDAEDKVNLESDSVVDQEALQSMELVKDDYLSRVIGKIERNKQYPRISRKRQREGDIVVGFIILSDGSVEQVNLLKRSRHNRLNEAAIEAVTKSLPFESIPKELNKEELAINLTISFRLEV